mmetsp:Transcript_25678/g.70613  ORF Transcript_25678/g.70613 Transcript_25678/m.70613 type:complete len:292 (+) Transcript_25678:104-979(+)
MACGGHFAPANKSSVQGTGSEARSAASSPCSASCAHQRARFGFCGRWQPEAPLLRHAVAELLPRIVRLRDDLQSLGRVQGLLLEAELVELLAVRRLVPAQPLTDPADHAGALLVDVRDVRELLRKGVVFADADDLPVQLAVVDHRQDPQHLDRLHGAHWQRLGADLHGIQRVIVADDLQLRVLVDRVFPRLGEHAVVPEDGPVVVAQLALLHVLLDGILWLLGVHLHLMRRHLGDLDDHVEEPLLGRVQRDVVPWRDLLAVDVPEAEPELRGPSLAVGLCGELLKQLDLVC